MARWLCRLKPEKLVDGSDCLAGAEEWGITGWVLCGLTPDQLALGPDRWMRSRRARGQRAAPTGRCVRSPAGAGPAMELPSPPPGCSMRGMAGAAFV